MAAHTLIFLDELMDYAMRLMSEAYVTASRQEAGADEAFRLFALGQDVNLERETQRAALMEWNQSVLFGLLGHGPRSAATKLSSSTFGLWLRHRAPILFQGTPQLARIEELAVEIDEKMLPALQEESTNARDKVATLQRLIEDMKFLLRDLFHAAAALEGGRDPLTRTLNRRFLAPVLNREMAFANHNKIPLSLAMVDVDHFKRINDQYGHAVGDVVLGHVAELLMESVRSSDFVFRYGGEEFLIVLSETSTDEAAVICERIRQLFMSHRISLSDANSLSVTVSIGITAYAGHPDYEYLVRSADSALYQAKSSGRNRIVVAAN